MIVLCFVVWAVLGYLSVRSGVSAANGRLPRGRARALTPQDGLLLDASTTILLLGTDHSITVRRAQSDRHSDSIMLLRTDPGTHRLYFLSIPRDLRVEIPGYGTSKINAAFQVGGPRLAMRTVSSSPASRSTTWWWSTSPTFKT